MPSNDPWMSLRPHVINLTEGKLSTVGHFQMAPSAIKKIFEQDLPAYIKASPNPRIVFYAHGGLVAEGDGLKQAQVHIPWWKANGVYPIYFIWETGPMETLWSLAARPDVRARAFGLREDLTAWSEEKRDDAFQIFARMVQGEKLWSRMKEWAANAVDVGGGAAEVADALVTFREAHPEVELHAVGHSAGAIFHSHFLPFCLAQSTDIAFDSLQFLAPAIRVDAFQSRLLPLLGRGIGPLTVYTMADKAELNDVCAHQGFTAYFKSLLYLIYYSLEPETQTPILGLQASLKDKRKVPDAVRIALGMTGTPSKRGTVIFGPTKDTPSPNATESASHGGFGNDPATLNSVAHRVLTAPPPVPFVQPVPAAAVLSLVDPLFGTMLDDTDTIREAHEPRAFSLDAPDRREQARQNLLRATEEFIAAYATEGI